MYDNIKTLQGQQTQRVNLNSIQEDLIEKVPWRIVYKGVPRYLRIGHSGGGSEWFIQYSQFVVEPEYAEPLDVVTTGTLNDAARMMLDKLTKSGVSKKAYKGNPNVTPSEHKGKLI